MLGPAHVVRLYVFKAKLAPLPSLLQRSTSPLGHMFVDLIDFEAQLTLFALLMEVFVLALLEHVLSHLSQIDPPVALLAT